MPIDPNIALQVRPIELPDPLQQYGRAITLSGLMQQQGLQRLQMQQAERELADDDAWRKLVAGGGVEYGPDGGVKLRDLGAAMQASPKRAMEFQARQVETEAKRAGIAKDRAQAAKYQSEVTRDAHMRAVQLLPTVKTPQDFALWAKSAVDSGAIDFGRANAMVSAVQADPTQLDALRERLYETGMSAADLAARTTPKPVEVKDGQTIRYVDLNPKSPTFGREVGPSPVQVLPSPEAVMTDARTRSEGAANRAVTLRGQNLVDARAQQTLAAGRWQNDFESGTQVNMATGERRPITDGGAPVGPRPKDMTDSQAKALLFGTRAADADRLLAERAAAGVERPGNIKSTAETALGLVPFAGEKLAPVAGTLTNWTQSNAQQSVERAQRDFINAILRRESGAVISPAEFENARLQYFPSPNDGPDVRAEKTRARQLAIQGILAEVPERARTLPGGPPVRPPAPPADVSAAAAPPPPPKPGTVIDGWLFNGGDPADKANWRRAGGAR